MPWSARLKGNIIQSRYNPGLGLEGKSCVVVMIVQLDFEMSIERRASFCTSYNVMSIMNVENAMGAVLNL